MPKSTAMMKKRSRLELNRDVRRIFARHRVDLSLLYYSCHGKNVTLSGILMKEGKRDFTALELDQMSQEIYRLKVGIISELENWSISSASIIKRGEKKDKKEDKDQKDDKTIKGLKSDEVA
jgi:hypothetical protein